MRTIKNKNGENYGRTNKKNKKDVTIAENAFEAVALGAGKSLEDIEKLKLYAQNGRKR